jgi:hypothetical protein
MHLVAMVVMMVAIETTLMVMMITVLVLGTLTPGPHSTTSPHPSSGSFRFQPHTIKHPFHYFPASPLPL